MRDAGRSDTYPISALDTTTFYFLLQPLALAKLHNTCLTETEQGEQTFSESYKFCNFASTSLLSHAAVGRISSAI